MLLRLDLVSHLGDPLLSCRYNKMATIMHGERGCRILVYHGFCFRFHRHNAAGLMSWICSDRRNCSCMSTTKAFDREAPNPVIQVMNESEHSGHPCQAEFIHNVWLREDMRSEAMDDPTRPLKSIYNGIVAREHP